MAIEFGSRKETFENYKVYEPAWSRRPVSYTHLTLLTKAFV